MGMKSAQKSKPHCECHRLWIVFILVALTPTVTGVVDVTIASKYQFFDESAGTWLYCYHTGSLIDQDGYRFGVEVDTGSGTVFSKQRNTGEIPGWWNTRILDDAGNFRVGAFSCLVSDGSQTEKAITFKIKEQADVWPVTFTVTANTGDPVTLQMVQKSSRTGTLEWRKGGVGGTVLTGQNGLSLTIASVQSSDEGIYECYYQGDTDRKQGIMRLIVRGCSENKWGVNCTGDCPVCYNGGVCDDNTGECVCPPGFLGRTCESACANNKIGTSCTRECEGGDCTGQLLCVMDPYGCSCAPGLMGIECNTVCSPGEFGPDCTGTCHCASGGSVCDVMTGVCSSGGCEAGWKGSNCQIECADGMYGAGCTQTCHCANGPAACNKTTGACTGGCHDLWTGDSCQIRTATVWYEYLFTKEEGRFFGESSDNITAYNDIDADECARRCLQGYGSYDGVTPPCLSFNHRPAGSPEGGSARCWLRSSDKDTAASPGPDWDSWSYGDYYQRKDILAPQDCADIFVLGIQYSHISTIGHPQPFQAYCDMDTDGGGWTVIQRRQDGSVPFDRIWTEYEQGFGNPGGECWLGLENIHSLTTQKQNELYVYLEDWEMNSRFARYSTFSVGDSGSKYTATIDGYSGDATDSLDPSDTRHSINTRQFSTTDQDNDGVASTDCAGTFGQGGWWYTPSCGYALLNGQYLIGCSIPAPPTCSSADGIVWNSWRGYTYSLKKTIMMIRPYNFSVSSYRPCQNGGTLTSGPEDSGLYICACEAGWNGPFCEQEQPTSPPPRPTRPRVADTATPFPTSRHTNHVITEAISKGPAVSANIALIAGGSTAALLMIVLVTVGIICYRRRNATERQDPIGDQMDLNMVTTNDSAGMESADNPACTASYLDSSPYETTIYSVADLVTVNDVAEFLKAKGFDEYAPAFKRHKIDGDAAMCLNDAVLAELIPEIGPRVKLQKALQELKDNPEAANSSRPVHSDWEIPRSSLTLGKILGKGQFGEVRLGELRKRCVTQTVAVKTLKVSAEEKDKEDLIGELDILVTIGRHDNIISLVGACTVEGPLTLVVEYAPNGCLKDWLKNNRPKELNQTDDKTIATSGIQLPMDQLIMFGIDIANGMSHLAAMQCVHRDLAARNVLLGSDLTAKISDFGLSRDIYEESEYVKSTKSQLPIRWIAYESLFYHVYTTQSDVWSFGILLWEIMTMGKKPYGRMTGKELMKLLPDGYRLEKPALCPQDVYGVMKTCWETLPENRPTFPQLKATLDRISQDYKTYASLLK